MKHTRVLFWLITVLSIFCVLVVLPKISLSGRSFDPQSFLRPVIGNHAIEFRRGLDLSGGTSLTLQADMKGISADKQDAALESAKEVIVRRVNPQGVSEPIIQTSTVNNQKRILVELPGITDIKEAERLVGSTGKLEFRQLTNATSAAAVSYENTIPTGLSGDDLQDAQPTFNQQTGQPTVSFTIASDSQDKFFQATQKLIGQPMVIFLDKQLISAPVVQQAIRDNGQITGNFTIEQTTTLANILNAGALKVPLKILEQQTIGPTLGAVSLQKTLFAGILGFLIIVIFMSVLYKKLGIAASVALFIYTMIVLAIFRLSTLTPYGVTLTLSGIAGFILSIGMAVDANILIFERTKEELRRGKTRNQAIEVGFSRAWPSIRDSNSSTLITSFILYSFGTGLVKGFALVLAIGVLVSMFSAIVVTRTFLRLMNAEVRK